MEITCLTVGDLSTNCYLLTDEDTNESLIIDPGDEGDFISTTILEKRVKPKAIVFTHGHYDHCLAALELKLNFNIPIYIHPEDLFLYKKSHLSAKHFSHISIPKPPPADHFLTDNDILTFGHSQVKVLHTPGHTPGSICLFSPGTLFAGDTLFAEGIGRTDLSYSSLSDLKKSLQKISKLPTNTTIYPGHGNLSLLTNTLSYSVV